MTAAHTVLVVAVVLVLPALVRPAVAADIDPQTGLAIAPGFEIVSAQCTVCHSGRLIAQSRADRQGWLAMIRWMQDKQGLWPLGDNEQAILDYLASQYAPTGSGRRKPLAARLMPPGT
jgi:hypothetical protein